jgi:hypothetical protein
VQIALMLRETAAKIAAMALRGEPLPNVVNGVKGVNEHRFRRKQLHAIRRRRSSGRMLTTTP